MPNAAVLGDMVKQDAPVHCHGPHPPVGNPIPHPGIPLAIVSNCAPTVMITNKPAATLTSQTVPCTLPCVPGGPGMVSMGSATVMIASKPAARLNDMTMHAACVAPIPAPTGKIIGPGAPTVMIGG